MRHVIAIDQGTTGSTVLVLDEKLQLRGRGYKEFRQLYPKPGWVEHDPEDIWGSVVGQTVRFNGNGATIHYVEALACTTTNALACVATEVSRAQPVIAQSGGATAGASACGPGGGATGG
jgi:glycerol kinase